MNDLEKEFNEVLEDEGLIMLIFNMAQDLAQCEDENAKVQALNVIVGSSFALLHAIKSYKEIRNGKSINYRS